MTVRLDLEDPTCRSFRAQIEATRLAEAGWEVALDRTCFYPTGGGQPCDLGTLGGLPVLDVYERDGRVWHVLAEAPMQASLEGEVDWTRRVDHMQQHSGQHILSAVALAQRQAQTLSFHLGAEAASIDLDAADLSSAAAGTIENECNRIVTAAIPVRAYFVTPEELPRLHLRKPPARRERTRIVEVEGVDLSPCGGTHVQNTGQIGPIKIRRLERYKGGTRVEFLCGWRALRDYQWKHEAISSLARDLSVADRELEPALRRALAGEKEARRQVEAMRAELLVYEAQSLRQAASDLGSFRLVARAFPERAPAEVKQLASRLVAGPGMVALLATQAPAARLFFMRSPDVGADMHRLLQQVTRQFGGGGGGRPESAEGGGLPPARIAEALAWAAQQLGAKPT